MFNKLNVKYVSNTIIHLSSIFYMKKGNVQSNVGDNELEEYIACNADIYIRVSEKPYSECHTLHTGSAAYLVHINLRVVARYGVKCFLNIYYG